MHEFSIVENIIQRVKENPQLIPGCYVDSIHLEIGMLSGIETEALEYAFNCLKESNTILNHAKLTYEMENGRFECTYCNRQFAADNFFQLCPSCKTANSRAIHGKDLFIKSITINKNFEP
jgi:hydrogenase nickel incorporation protein HypA/HybF